MSIVPVCHSKKVDIFACAQAGCRDCLEALLRGNEGLIHHILKRQGIGGIEYQDLIQEGRIALWRSVLHFDPGRGTAFSTYAGLAIHNQFWRCLGTADQSQGYVEVEECFDLFSQAEEAWQQEQLRQMLREELECLPERLRQVIVGYYGLAGQPPFSLGELGQQLGVSGERIRVLRNTALVLLRLPALSLRLRSLSEQDGHPAYRRALSLNRAWQRSRRRP